MFKRGPPNSPGKNLTPEAEPEKQMTFEQFSATKGYKLQQDLVELVKSKIVTADREKVQLFYKKLNEGVRAADGVPKVDEMTLRKIQDAVFKKQSASDQELFEQSLQQSNIRIGDRHPSFSEHEEQYLPASHNWGDSQKQPRVTKNEYEDFLYFQEEALLNEIALDHGIPAVSRGPSTVNEEAEGEEEGAESQVDDRDDIALYQNVMDNIKRELLSTH